MILSMSRQAILFLMTVGAGFTVGFIYDLFRIIRKTAPHNNVAIQIEDLLYWLLATMLIFYFMLNKNYGEIRLFSILGAVLGAVLYLSTLSFVVMAVSVAVIEFIKKVILTIVKIILIPIRLSLKLLMPPIRGLVRLFRKRLHSLELYGRMKLRGTAKALSVILKKI